MALSDDEQYCDGAGSLRRKGGMIELRRKGIERIGRLATNRRDCELHLMNKT